MLKMVMIIMDIKTTLKQIYFMEELISYLLNYAMIIVANVMNLVIQLIVKNVNLVYLIIVMIIGIILIKLLNQIVFLKII